MTRDVGIVLVIFGISLFLLSMTFTRPRTVIDTAFSLESGEKYPTDYFPPRDCVLKGKVSVEGEGINLTVAGPDYSLNVFVDSYFNFTIDRAYGWDHVYFFAFDNTDGDAENHVEFVLEESNIYPFVACPSLLGSFLLLPLGFILILRGSHPRKKETNRSD